MDNNTASVLSTVAILICVGFITWCAFKYGDGNND